MTSTRQIWPFQDNMLAVSGEYGGMQRSRDVPRSFGFLFLFGCVFSSLLRCGSKYFYMFLAVYILRGYRDRINENLFSKKKLLVRDLIDDQWMRRGLGCDFSFWLNINYLTDVDEMYYPFFLSVMLLRFICLLALLIANKRTSPDLSFVYARSTWYGVDILHASLQRLVSSLYYPIISTYLVLFLLWG